MEDGAREPRLPRGVRSSLLLRALHPGPRERGAALHRDDDRGLLAGPARGVPRPKRRARPSHDDPRAHAEGASEAPGLDAVAAGPLGNEHRARDGGAGGGDPRRPAAPRAGLPLVPGHPAPGQALRARAARGRLHARGSGPCALVSPCRLDPEARPGSRAAARDRDASSAPRARERARRRLLRTRHERRRCAC